MKNINETKQKLLDATRYMIDTKGIDSVNMRDLGKEMNLSRSAVYRHFDNKEGLLAAIATEDFEAQKSVINKLTEEIDDPRELVFAILVGFYNFGMNKQPHYHLMFRKQWNQDMYPYLHISARELYGVLGECFAQAFHATNKSIREITALASAFIVGLVDLNYAGHLESEKGLDDPSDLINLFIDLLLNKSN